MVQPHEKFLQHVQEENTPEFKKFKQISNEDKILVDLIKKNISLGNNHKILDVGGREGYISLALTSPDRITIVDPDPKIDISNLPIKLIREKIQNVSFEEKFDLIIASHVWGDFDREGVSRDVLKKLYHSLNIGGSLVIGFNSNTGYMKDLLLYAKESLKHMRYDYLPDGVPADIPEQNIKKIDFTTPLQYESFEELGRGCWMLFATSDDDISETAKIFIPYLEKTLDKSAFELNQTLLIVSQY